MKLRQSLLTLAALLGVFSLGMASNADVIGTTGNIVDIGSDGPAFSAIPDGPGESDDFAFAWNEKSGILLGAGLAPEVLGPIAAGTIVNSHLVRFDPRQSGVSEGTISFDSPILGIFTSRDSLDMTDFLGSPGTAYPGHPSAALRGLEPADFLGIVDADTIRIRWTASSPGDQIRVLTAAVPEPGSVALLLGLASVSGLVVRRRVRR